MNSSKWLPLIQNKQNRKTWSSLNVLKWYFLLQMLPSSTDISQANGQPEDHEIYVKVNLMTGSIPANSQQKVDSIHSSCITPNVFAGSPVKLTSPERIIALHRELRQNHRKNRQVSKNFLGFSLVIYYSWQSFYRSHRYLNDCFQRCTVDC